MSIIEPGTPFPELHAACQDIAAAVTKLDATVARYGRTSQLVDFDLRDLEEALEAASKHLNIEQLARVGIDGHDPEEMF